MKSNFTALWRTINLLFTFILPFTLAISTAYKVAWLTTYSILMLIILSTSWITYAFKNILID